MILLHFDEVGICASSGSACTSDSLEPSHVLRAMGVPFTSLHGSIRFSLSHFTTEEEIEPEEWCNLAAYKLADDADIESAEYIAR
jgi:cysteine sulfinate desulfinase/cysteine desulfurase-like protein